MSFPTRRTRSPTGICFLIVNGRTTVRSTYLPMVLNASRRTNAHDPRRLLLMVVLPIITLRNLRSTSPTRQVTRLIRRATTNSHVLGRVLIVFHRRLELTNYRLKVKVRRLSRQDRPIVDRLRVTIRRGVVLYLCLLRHAIMTLNGTRILLRRSNLSIKGLDLRGGR